MFQKSTSLKLQESVPVVSNDVHDFVESDLEGLSLGIL